MTDEKVMELKQGQSEEEAFTDTMREEAEKTLQSDADESNEVTDSDTKDTVTKEELKTAIRSLEDKLDALTTKLLKAKAQGKAHIGPETKEDATKFWKEQGIME